MTLLQGSVLCCVRGVVTGQYPVVSVWLVQGLCSVASVGLLESIALWYPWGCHRTVLWYPCGCHRTVLCGTRVVATGQCSVVLVGLPQDSAIWYPWGCHRTVLCGTRGVATGLCSVVPVGLPQDSALCYPRGCHRTVLCGTRGVAPGQCSVVSVGFSVSGPCSLPCVSVGFRAILTQFPHLTFLLTALRLQQPTTTHHL